MSKKTSIEVSIIMSEYNTDKYFLGQSIDSLLEQTFSRFELIIINDSDNNSLMEILSGYSDKRIRVINNSKNMGLVYSLNKAINASNGKFLVRMDTDDIAYPNRIEKLYDFIEKNPEYSVVGSRAIEFSEKGDLGVLSKAGEKTPKDIMRGDTLVHPSVIMRKKDVLEVGGYDDYKRSEDLALWCKMLLAKKRLYVMDDILLRYRVNSKDYKKRGISNRLGEIEARIHYYPLLKAGPREYFRIVKSVVAGLVPTGLVSGYRKNFVLHKPALPKLNFEINDYPKVSVIIPVYNVGSYLHNCIDSILAQTHKNIDVVLVDDGSTDGSSAICDNYAQQDNRVRVFHKMNSGSSDSRNLGIDEAIGEYILFVDADDYVSHNMLKNMLSLIGTDIDIVSCGYSSVTGYDSEKKYVKNGTGDTRLFDAKQALEDMMYVRSITNTPWAKLYRTSLFEGIRFQSGKINQDLGTMYKVFGRARKICVVDMKMYMYMYRPDSVINSRFTSKRIAGLEFANEQHEYIRENFPSIERAAIYRLFMECIFVLKSMRFMDTINYKKEYEKYRKVISSTRMIVFSDKEVPVKHKIFVISTYVGLWTIVSIGYLIRDIQRLLRLKDKAMIKLSI